MDVRQRLDCDDVLELLPLVADGCLDCDDDPALFEHLAGCDECQAALAQHDLVTLAIGEGQTPPPTPEPIRFVRLPWAAAAGWLLAAAGLLGVWLLHSAPAQPGTDDPASTVAEPQVIGVRETEQGTRAFILRVGDQTVETEAADSLRDQPETNADQGRNAARTVGRSRR